MQLARELDVYSSKLAGTHVSCSSSIPPVTIPYRQMQLSSARPMTYDLNITCSLLLTAH